VARNMPMQPPMSESACSPPSQAKALERGQRSERRAFDLRRWFSWLSLFSIVTMTTTSAYLISSFLATNLLQRDAELTRDFVQGMMELRTARVGDEPAVQWNAPDLEDLFRHLATMPDVAGANVYDVSGLAVWSSTSGMIGQRFANSDLTSALGGRLITKSSRLDEHQKQEHAYVLASLGPHEQLGRFIEIYIPLRDAASQVTGVVEVYKLPRAMLQAIDQGNRLVWTIAVLSGVFLYATLYWIVRRGSRTIRVQQERLIESETLATMGEMACAVGHGIRNPLASIRSSAELALGDSAVERECLQDIIAEVDRLERWVRDLLVQSHAETPALGPLQLNELIRECAAGFKKRVERQGVRVRTALEHPLPELLADAKLLRQVLNGLLANAVEAMPLGGAVTVTARRVRGGRALEVVVADSGPGIPDDILAHVFRPRYTTKRTGLGLGLAQARRIVERHGGSIWITSRAGCGTKAHLRLPVRG
jgi:two-component system, NtrC family, sensor histidine kinase HydH